VIFAPATVALAVLVAGGLSTGGVAFAADTATEIPALARLPARSWKVTVTAWKPAAVDH
jgi:hypothetical protein